MELKIHSLCRRKAFFLFNACKNTFVLDYRNIVMHSKAFTGVLEERLKADKTSTKGTFWEKLFSRMNTHIQMCIGMNVFQRPEYIYYIGSRHIMAEKNAARFS